MFPWRGSPQTWLLAGLGLTGFGVYLWLNGPPGIPILSVAQAPRAVAVESAPGGPQTPEYARLQALANHDRVGRARPSGGSAMPSPGALESMAPPPATPSATVTSTPPASIRDRRPATPPRDEALLRAMETQMKELIAYRDRRFVPPPTRLVALNQPKAPRAASATESAIPAQAVAGERAARPDASGGLRPGDLLHAVLQTAIHSDEPGPVRARVVGERFREAILLGSLEKLPAPVGSWPERVLVRFRSMTLPTGATSTLDAYAVDPATGRTALATDVDHHYAARWGALIAASFLEGYGQAVASRHRIVSVGPFGNVISVPGDGMDHDQIAREALGTVGARLGDAVGQQFNRPNTIRVDAGTAIGVLVVSAAPPTGAPDLRSLGAPVEAGQSASVPPPTPSSSEPNP